MEIAIGSKNERDYTSELKNNKSGTLDFSLVLNRNALEYKTDDYYHSVSFGCAAEYQVLYISIIQSQILDLSEVLVPFFSSEKLSFRLVKNQEIATWVLHGLLGYDHIGKVIMIYLPTNRDFQDITQQLVAFSKCFKGPEIPNEIHLGGSVYLMKKDGEIIQNQRLKRYQLLENKYMLSAIIKPDPKGDVWEGTYIYGLFGTRKCIIKEGRKFMWSDTIGRDMKDRLEWQKTIHKELRSQINMPEVIDLFEYEGNTYLVLEFIKGKTMEQMINEIFYEKSWMKLPSAQKIKLVDILLEVLEIVENIHKNGYVHRDLNPANFILTSKNKLYLIDLELAYSYKTEYPLPPFGLGTIGFMSPEQINEIIPTEKEDVYGLGALMTILFTGAKSVDPIQSSDQIRGNIYSITKDEQLANIIRECLSTSVEQRPRLSKIKEVAQEIKSRITL